MQTMSSRPVASWDDVVGAWRCVDMYVEEHATPTLAGAVRRIVRPFGNNVCGSITYTPTQEAGVMLVHALIASRDAPGSPGAAGAEALHLGKFEWMADDKRRAIERATTSSIVTHYVGTATLHVAAGEQNKGRIDHYVIGSANKSYIGKTLGRDARVSVDGQFLLLCGPLGMQPSSRGFILWQRVANGKL